MKFKVIVTIDYDNFDVPEHKAKSMVNGMQRDQAQWFIEDLLKGAQLNPVIHNIHKVRS